MLLWKNPTVSQSEIHIEHVGADFRPDGPLLQVVAEASADPEGKIWLGYVVVQQQMQFGLQTQIKPVVPFSRGYGQWCNGKYRFGWVDVQPQGYGKGAVKGPLFAGHAVPGCNFQVVHGLAGIDAVNLKKLNAVGQSVIFVPASKVEIFVQSVAQGEPGIGTAESPFGAIRFASVTIIQGATALNFPCPRWQVARTFHQKGFAGHAGAEHQCQT